MIAVGHEAELRWNNTVVARAKDINLQISKEALDSTTLGLKDRTYIPGLRNATGSCTLMFDPNDTITESFLNSITTNNTSNPDGEATLNFAPNGGRFVLNVILTNVGITANSGDLVTASVQFQVTGPLPNAAF
jgi:hypothetical protein